MASKGKSKDTEEEIHLLGRPGNTLQAGIVGLPNVGKSTLFNILTKMNRPAENRPFCTIDPSESRVPVPDERFDHLVSAYSPKSVVPAVLHVMDIAGLVRGASQGEGLGNAFLSHIRSVDGILHVVRAFDDIEVSHVEDSVDPIRDMGIISDELRLKDVETLEKKLEAMKKKLRGGKGDAHQQVELGTLEKALAMVSSGKDVRFGQWVAAEIEVLNTLDLLTAKSMVHLVNISERDFLRKKNKWLPKIAKWVAEHNPGESILPFSGTMEATLDVMDAAQRSTYFAENPTCKSAIPKIIVTTYHALNLIHFFTSGPDEVRAWTIRKGTKAPQAAGVIHTDFERGFIKAETMEYADFKEHGSEAAVKAAGKYRSQGKQYTMKDGDIVLVKFNVTSEKKKQEKK